MSLLSEASLIVTPNGVKEGKLYSVIPSDGSGDMSVVRATTATRVNSAGLVELVPYNYNTYSENFITSWGNDGSSTVTNNFTTAPNGMMTAAKLVSNVANGYGYKFNTVPNGTFTLSYYIKASANTTISIAFNDIGGNGYIASYNIPVTTEWQRISLTANLVGTSLLIDYSQLQLGVEYYIWGCQINEGTLKDYQKTETRLNIPRLDYSNGTCPSLLVEPQRTNLALYSSSFDNAAWDKAASSVTANQIASPSGVQDADKLTENSANDIHGLYNLNPYTSITTATASLFFKKGTRKFFSIKLQIGANSYTQVYDSESVTTTSNSSNGLTSVSTSIVDFGNGWVRATLTGTNPSGAADAYTVYCLSNSGTPTFNPSNFNPTYQGTGTDYGYLWGAQLEAGSYPTSYIPTTSASVTRNSDAIFKTGISSLIGQTEGVAFIDFVWNGLTGTGSYPRILELWGDSNNYIQLFNVAGTSTIYWDIYNGGVVQFSGSSTMALGHNKAHQGKSY